MCFALGIYLHIKSAQSKSIFEKCGQKVLLGAVVGFAVLCRPSAFAVPLLLGIWNLLEMDVKGTVSYCSQQHHYIV